MADLRSIITVDVDATAFDRFKNAFDNYRKEAVKMQDTWKKIGESTKQAGSKSADSLEAATDQMKKAAGESRKANDELNKFAKTSKTIKENTAATSGIFNNWAKVLGTIGTMYGIGRSIQGLSQFASDERRAAQRMGLPQNELGAARTQLQRVIDVDSILSNINKAKNDPMSRIPFEATSSGERIDWAKSSSDILAKWLPALQKFANGNWSVPQLQALGLSNIGIDTDQLRLLQAVSPKELNENIEEYKKQSVKGPIDEVEKNWQDLNVVIKQSEVNIRKAFLGALGNATPKIKQILGLDTQFVEEILSGETRPVDVIKEYWKDLTNGGYIPKFNQANKPEEKITEELLDRLKMTESSGNPYAINKTTGALGAYQFMPGTVNQLSKQWHPFNVFDEKESREAARWYLEQLLGKNGGDLDKALAAYGGFVTKDPSKYIQSIRGGQPNQYTLPSPVGGMKKNGTIEEGKPLNLSLLITNTTGAQVQTMGAALGALG